MRFSAFNSNGDIIATNEFFSIGGGFVVNEATRIQKEENVYYKDNRVDHVTEVKVDNASLNKIILNDKINIDAYNNNITASTTTTSTRTTTTPPSPPTSSSTDNSLIAAENKTNLITATLPFYNASSLLRVCQHENLSIAQVVFKNEMQWRSPEEVKGKRRSLLRGGK